MTPETPASRPRQRVSRQGLELIKSFEGLRRKSARLPGGRYVVGYGHIRSAREGAEVSEADAEALLRYDLLPLEAAVNEWTFAPLTQNQFDALVSFAFSVGAKTFRRSDVLRRINEGAMLQAAAALDMWRRVELDGEGVVVDALVRRRAAEKALFLKPAAGHVPAPSAVLKPTIDFAAYRSVPRRRPEMVETPLVGDEATIRRTIAETPDPVDASPVKAAAANVSARLSELLADDEAPFDAPDLSEADVLESEADAANALRQGFAVRSEDEELDGDFMQAPPSPPHDDDRDEQDTVFPELDLAPAPEPMLITPEAAPAPDADAPVVDLAELPPFPEDADMPAHLAAQAAEPGFEDSYEPELADGFDQNSGAQPTQGDPAALSQPEEGPDNGPYIYLFLAGLALVVAAAVTFFRTPDAGAAQGGSGLGWVLGLLGVAGVAGALWAIMGREDAVGDDPEEA